ncbi:MAG: hypothetical protein O7A09_09075, partial [Proteobacteria bacterium]|nr:hypothetical protein [Pseudomonadota bacterium]
VPLSLGVGWRALWPLVAGLLVCLWLYLWVLPGEVGAFIEVRPWEAVRNASLWLGSPVYHLLKSFGLSAGGARSLGALAGALASVALPVLWWTRPRGPASRAEAGFFSVAAFALGTALVVGLTRTGQHAATPGEVVAVRHLTWPSLFWAASLILWGLRAHCARRYRSAAVRSWAALLAALPLLMIQVQLDFVRAYEEIHHRMRLGLFALIVGVRDDDAVRFVRRGFDVVYAMAEELRARELGIFAWDEARLLGRPLEAALRPAADGVAGGIVALRPLPGDASGAKFRGWAIDTSTREPPRYAVAVNSAGRITGLGGFGTPRPEVARAAGLDPATRIGLVGYIRDYDPEARYRFFAVREDGVTAVPLSVLPAPRG